MRKTESLDEKLATLRRHKVAVYKESPTGEIAVEFDPSAFVQDVPADPERPPEETIDQAKKAFAKTALRSAG